MHHHSRAAGVYSNHDYKLGNGTRPLDESKQSQGSGDCGRDGANGGNHFATGQRIRSTRCTPETYTMVASAVYP